MSGEKSNSGVTQRKKGQKCLGVYSRHWKRVPTAKYDKERGRDSGCRRREVRGGGPNGKKMKGGFSNLFFPKGLMWETKRGAICKITPTLNRHPLDGKDTTDGGGAAQGRNVSVGVGG